MFFYIFIIRGNEMKKEKAKDNEKMFARGYNNPLITIISIILLIAILSVIVATVLISVNTTNETEETGIQAMAQRRDYIKEIQKVEKDNEYMTMQEDAEGQKVPVPNGYVGSSVDGENTVKGGYVIYEKTDEERKSNSEVTITDSDAKEARKTRNQYVWVPVNEEQLSKMYGIDSNGKMWGKLYNFSESDDNATGTTPNNWSENEGVMKLKSSTNNREPDIVKQYDIPRYFRQYGLNAESALEHLMNLELEFETSIESIAKYGGFYIGRYETGGLKGEAVVRRMDTDLGSQTWYSMYEKCKELRGANENVVTSMIFGSQFDRTLMWLIESNNNIDKADVATDSQEWGNYNNVELMYDKDGNGEAETQKKSGSNTIIPAGSSEKTKANNIYDLCGNVDDWTIELCKYIGRVLRGGGYNCESTYYPASNRSGFGTPDTSETYMGCRAALYVR